MNRPSSCESPQTVLVMISKYSKFKGGATECPFATNMKSEIKILLTSSAPFCKGFTTESVRFLESIK